MRRSSGKGELHPRAGIPLGSGEVLHDFPEILLLILRPGRIRGHILFEAVIRVGGNRRMD